MPRSGFISITMGVTHGINNENTSAPKGLNNREIKFNPFGAVKIGFYIQPWAYTHGYLNYALAGH